MKFFITLLLACITTIPLSSQTNTNDSYYFTRIGVHSINEVNLGYGFRTKSDLLIESTFGINWGSNILNQEIPEINQTGFLLRTSFYPSQGHRFALTASSGASIIRKNFFPFYESFDELISINYLTYSMGFTLNFWNQNRTSFFIGPEMGLRITRRTINNFLGEIETTTSEETYGRLNLAIQIKFEKEKDSSINFDKVSP